MSDNILKELYNKVLSLFKQTEQEDENAKDVAKNRLRVVLMQDRTNLTPELLQRMRKELVELLSKYVEMDKEALELNFDQEGDQMALMLSIPVIRAKDEEEIQKALEEEDKDSEEEISDDNEEDSEEEEYSQDDETDEENSEELSNQEVEDDENEQSEQEEFDASSEDDLENKNDKEEN